MRVSEHTLEGPEGMLKMRRNVAAGRGSKVFGKRGTELVGVCSSRKERESKFEFEGIFVQGRKLE
jgi:hypothetical protein